MKAKTDYVLLTGLIQLLVAINIVLFCVAPETHRSHAQFHVARTQYDSTFDYDCD